jgi:hypothetical protein
MLVIPIFCCPIVFRTSPRRRRGPDCNRDDGQGGTVGITLIGGGVPLQMGIDSPSLYINKLQLIPGLREPFSCGNGQLLLPGGCNPLFEQSNSNKMPMSAESLPIQNECVDGAVYEQLLCAVTEGEGS